MWECLNCGHTFEELEEWEEDRGECFGFPARETMYGCMCGSTDVVEIDTEEEFEEWEEINNG